MRLLRVQRALGPVGGSNFTAPSAPRVRRVGIATGRTACSHNSAPRLNGSRKSTVCSSASTEASRAIPEGLLSREEGSDSEIGTAVRTVPEGLLSREEEPSKSDQQRFNWFQQWYPVAALNALDPSRPHAFTLLGQNLVLWRDGSGSWRVFKDACPHRLAPLSEGRIEKDGSLLCAYHGWRFEGSGACTALPYCSPDDPALSSPRSCAVTYPALERGGVLWVWGEGGPGAAEAAATKQPQLPPEVQDDGSPAPGASFPQGWSHRDLPYGHTFFIENVVDPAHVPVSHHNVAGNRYSDPRPFHMELTRPVSREGGFEIRIPDPMRKEVRTSTTEFVPPGYVRIQQYNKNGSRTVLALYSTPLRPGWTRLVGQQMMIDAPGAEGGRARSAVGFVGASLPLWLAHTLGALFMNQDMVFLHYQELEVARRQAQMQQQRRQQQLLSQTASGHRAQGAVPGGNGADPDPAAASGSESTSPTSSAPLPQAEYFMPGQVDRGVAAWRNWLFTYGGGDVSYAPGTPPLLASSSAAPAFDRSQLFDVWNTHTRHCTICLAALTRIRIVRTVAAALGAAAVALAVAAVVARAAAGFAAAEAATTAAAGSPAIAAGGGGAASVFAAVLKAVGSVLFGSREGVAALAVAAVAGVVVAACGKVEALMHVYEYSHADNH